MCRTRKGDTVTDDIRPARFDWPNVRRRDLNPPASIDELQTGDSAALIIGAQDNTTKDAIS